MVKTVAQFLYNKRYILLLISKILIVLIIAVYAYLVRVVEGCLAGTVISGVFIFLGTDIRNINSKVTIVTYEVFSLAVINFVILLVARYIRFLI